MCTGVFDSLNIKSVGEGMGREGVEGGQGKWCGVQGKEARKQNVDKLMSRSESRNYLMLKKVV